MTNKFKPYIGREDDFQRSVARILDAAGLTWCHPPNGGFRNKIEAGKLKSMGVKSGVPDILVFEGNKFFSGLAIELKVGKNQLSDTQKDWLTKLDRQGWSVHCSYSLDEVIDIVNEYLSHV